MDQAEFERVIAAAHARHLQHGYLVLWLDRLRARVADHRAMRYLPPPALGPPRSSVALTNSPEARPEPGDPSARLEPGGPSPACWWFLAAGAVAWAGLIAYRLDLLSGDPLASVLCCAVALALGGVAVWLEAGGRGGPPMDSRGLGGPPMVAHRRDACATWEASS